MENFSMDLICEDTYKTFHMINVKMYESRPVFNIENVNSTFENNIYCDGSYKIKIADENAILFQVEVLLNGHEIDSDYHDDEITFPKNNKIFNECLGFAEIELVLTYKNGREKTLYSDYLNVLIRDNEISKTIINMAKYVYKNQESFLFQNEMKALYPSGTRESSNKSIETILNAIDKIIFEYKNCFSYFKANSKFSLVNSNKFDDYEKIKYVNSSTIRSIVTNPEQLIRTDCNTGINICGKNYIPRKTLIVDNKKDYDIYENQIVVNFLFSLNKKLRMLMNKAEKDINFMPNYKYEEGYISSAYKIFSISKTRLENFILELKKKSKEIQEIYYIYSNLLKVKHIEVKRIPKPTHTFLSVKYYNNIFMAIVNWFKNGLYFLEKEEFIMPFLANNQLYEYYLLIKFIKSIKNNNYELYNTDKHSYKKPKYAKNFNNVKYINTFNFTNGKNKITLYYQPVLHLDASKCSNGITIVRNNPFKLYSEKEGYYYLPDYLIKVEKEGKNLYLFADAKFSYIDTVKKYHLAPVCFKYLFSCAPINLNDEIVGLCIFNGKQVEMNPNIKSIYTKHIPSEYKPRADVITISESLEDEKLEEKHLKIIFEWIKSCL